MIPLFDGDGNRLPITYNGLTINVVNDVEGLKNGYEVTAISQSSAADFVSEKLQWRDGLDVNSLTRGGRLIVMNGYIWGTSIAGLCDRAVTLATAFDPGRIGFVAEMTDSDGFLPMTFSTPTNNTTLWPTGFVESKIFVMPTEVPIPTIAKSGQGLSARFRITLLAKDPRRYLQTPQTLTDAGTMTIAGAGYPTYPILDFTMSGAGSSSFTIQNVSGTQGTKSLVLDLSGRSNGQAIQVRFNTRQVFVNGVNTPGIFKSGDWFRIEVGNNVISYSNTTNVGTRTLTTYPAFSV